MVMSPETKPHQTRSAPVSLLRGLASEWATRSERVSQLSGRIANPRDIGWCQVCISSPSFSGESGLHLSPSFSIFENPFFSHFFPMGSGRLPTGDPECGIWGRTQTREIINTADHS